MRDQNEIYFWKRLYWQAIQDGYAPGQAEEFANEVLAKQLAPQTPSTAQSQPRDGHPEA